MQILVITEQIPSRFSGGCARQLNLNCVGARQDESAEASSESAGHRGAQWG